MEAERGGAECQGCGGVKVSHPTSHVSTPPQLPLREAQVSTRADVPRGMITWTFLGALWNLFQSANTQCTRKCISSQQAFLKSWYCLSVTQFPLQVMDTCFISCMCYKNKYIKNCRIPRSPVISARYVLLIGSKKMFCDSMIQMHHSRSPAHSFLQQQGMPESLCWLLFIYSEWLQHLGFPAGWEGADSDASGAAGCSGGTTVLPVLGPGRELPTLSSTGTPSPSSANCSWIITSDSPWRLAQAASGHWGAMRDSWRCLCASCSGGKSSSKSIQ